jgi:hypothetical protein
MSLVKEVIIFPNAADDYKLPDQLRFLHYKISEFFQHCVFLPYLMGWSIIRKIMNSDSGKSIDWQLTISRYP